MSYLPTPLTQRDGSTLAVSNCRPTSIAMGLDYHTTGSKKSTGAKMRSYMSDQSGGTDSADAKEAWTDGYNETLAIRDGETFDTALADLNNGRFVHLDVWHATVGGPCLSGTGRYGHTIAVAPDQNANGWNVADPWCNPPKWSRVSTAKLRAGAEEWGRRVYASSSTTGADVTRDQLSFAAKLLMARHYPGNEDISVDPGETGGAGAILYTTTKAIRETAVAGVSLKMLSSYDGTAIVQGNGHSWIRIWDGHMEGAPDGFSKHVFAKAQLINPYTTPGGTVIKAGTPVVLIGDDAAFFLEQDVALSADDNGAFEPVGELYVRK